MYSIGGTRYAWTGELLLPVKLANSFVITVIIYKLKFNYQQYLNFFSFIHIDIYFKRSIYNYILFHSVILQYKLIIANNHSHFHDSLTECKTMYNNSNFFLYCFSQFLRFLVFHIFILFFLVPQFLFSFYFQFLNFSLNFSYFFVFIFLKFPAVCRLLFFLHGWWRLSRSVHSIFPASVLTRSKIWHFSILLLFSQFFFEIFRILYISIEKNIAHSYLPLPKILQKSIP